MRLLHLAGRFTVAAALTLALASPARGQATTSTLAGTVRDASRAVLPGARVTARHLETGLTRTADAGAYGGFLLPALPLGAYEVRAERAGFRTLTRRGVSLVVGQPTVVDFVLDPGGVEEAVTVTAEASAVQTRSGELSYLVGEDAVRDLPLNGRSYTDLALLQPGVVAFPHRDGGSVVAHGLAISVNGQDPRSNVYLLDGTPLNDFTNGPAGSAAGTALGAETVREFRVEVNAYGAEFGRNSGGQIHVVTKSGTNQRRGSGYAFHRNDALDSRNHFDPPGGKPEFRRNQLGATLGGPLRRDRAFFFVGYEALREDLTRTVTTFVPDLDARRGILPDPASPGRSLIVPVSPEVRPFLDAFPLPTGPSIGGGLAEFSFPFAQRLDQDFFQVRFDQNLRGHDQLFVRYTLDDAGQRLPTDFPQFPRTFRSRNQFLTAEYRRVASARTLHTARLSLARTRIGQEVEANLATPLPPFVPGRPMMGDIDVGGIPRFGPQSSADVSLRQTVLGGEYGLLLTRGRHFLKTGALVERYWDDMFNPTFSLGIYTFANLEAFLRNRPLRFLGLTPAAELERAWRFTLVGLYVQDDVRLASRLTLNAGLRYEFTTMPEDIEGRDSTLVRLSDPAPTVGRLYRNPTKRNVSPRLGFAWDVGGDGRASVRGGYGLYFNTNVQQNLIVTVTNPPATPRVIIANPTFPSPPFERGVGNSIRPVRWDLASPRVHVFNLSLQRQLGSDLVAMVGYAGSRGRHLLRNSDANVPVPQRLADGTIFYPPTAARPNPAFSTIEMKTSDGESWYDALVVEVRRRRAGGLSFQSSYTFSRNIDTTQASTFFSDATNGTVSFFPEPFGIDYNKGLADYHAKHNWVFNVTWDLPVGRNANGLAGALLGGWQLAAIGQVRSGNPLTAFVQNNRVALALVAVDRPGHRPRPAEPGPRPDAGECGHRGSQRLVRPDRVRTPAGGPARQPRPRRADRPGPAGRRPGAREADPLGAAGGRGARGGAGRGVQRL